MGPKAATKANKSEANKGKGCETSDEKVKKSKGKNAKKKSMESKSSKSIMTILLQLPDEICGFVLSLWLSAKDLLKLDSANCSAEIRPQFLRQLTLSPGIRPYKDCGEWMNTPPRMIQWCNNRDIKLKDIFLSERCFTDGKLNVNWNFVDTEDVYVFYRDPALRQAVSDVLSRCENIQSLKCNPLSSASFPTDQLSRLTSLNVSGYSFGNLPICSRIIENCTKLIYLRLEEYGADDHDAQVAEIIERNRNLIWIHSMGTQLTMDAIIGYCKNVEEVDLLKARISLTKIGQLVSQHPDISRFAAQQVQLFYAKDVDGMSLFVQKHSFSLQDGDDDDKENYDINYLVTCVKGLSQFHIMSMPYFTNESVECLLRHSSTTLTKVVLYDCNLITTDTILSILRECPRLNNLGFCLPDQKSIKSIFKGKSTSQLTHLRVDGMNNINFLDVVKMIEACPLLIRGLFNGVNHSKEHFKPLKECLMARYDLYCHIFSGNEMKLKYEHLVFKGYNVKQYLTQKENQRNNERNEQYRRFHDFLGE